MHTFDASISFLISLWNFWAKARQNACDFRKTCLTSVLSFLKNRIRCRKSNRWFERVVIHGFLEESQTPGVGRVCRSPRGKTSDGWALLPARSVHPVLAFETTTWSFLVGTNERRQGRPTCRTVISERTTLIAMDTVLKCVECVPIWLFLSGRKDVDFGLHVDLGIVHMPLTIEKTVSEALGSIGYDVVFVTATLFLWYNSTPTLSTFMMLTTVIPPTWRLGLKLKIWYVFNIDVWAFTGFSSSWRRDLES